jgi:hypothetical protein
MVGAGHRARRLPSITARAACTLKVKEIVCADGHAQVPKSREGVRRSFQKTRSLACSPATDRSTGTGGSSEDSEDCHMSRLSAVANSRRSPTPPSAGPPSFSSSVRTVYAARRPVGAVLSNPAVPERAHGDGSATRKCPTWAFGTGPIRARRAQNEGLIEWFTKYLAFVEERSEIK